jgi:hypothetical protein
MCFRPPSAGKKEIKCPMCGAVNLPTAKKCVKCGAEETAFAAAPAAPPGRVAPPLPKAPPPRPTPKAPPGPPSGHDEDEDEDI